MKTYHKIETVYERSMEGDKRLLVGQYRSETIAFLKDSLWEFTEKIDGTNIRICWDGHNVSILGRTEKSDIQKNLYDYLMKEFCTNEVEELFEQQFGERTVILFGEGYGANVQGVGKQYRPDVSFILFDVLIGENYQSRDNVEKIAKAFGVDVVPVVLRGTIDDGIEFVKSNPKSTIGWAMMEGVVGRPAVELRDRAGERVVVKIKWHDFRHFV